MTHEFPYHVVARSNNKESFYLPIHQCWQIFSRELKMASDKFGIRIYAFVLMDNHYHLILQTIEKYPLWEVMQWFQRTVNRRINDRSGRINHVFGGPYRASLITTEAYYFHAIKYVYANPIRAGIVSDCSKYWFSSLVSTDIRLKKPSCGIDSFLPGDGQELIQWVNTDYSLEATNILRKSLQKTQMKFASQIPRQVMTELKV